jgi:DNA polymerase III subunit delta
MILKYPDTFDAHLKQPLLPLYIITGQDSFLLNSCVRAIKRTWKTDDTDEKRLYLEHASDWEELMCEAESYGLFHDTLILDASLNKKTLDAKSKTTLSTYLEERINSRTLIIIRAPLLPIKQLSAFNANKHVGLINISPLKPRDHQQWVARQLKQRHFTCMHGVVELIQTYTQGHVHAAAQTIERLALVHEPNTCLSLDDVHEQLLDVRDYKLYELSGACLEGNAHKALDLAARAKQDQTEPTHILWFITQELRLLEQLHAGISAQALNIRSFRVGQYQQAKNRCSQPHVYHLLRLSQALDTHIKSGDSAQTWMLLEQLIVTFCNPKPVTAS